MRVNLQSHACALLVMGLAGSMETSQAFAPIPQVSSKQSLTQRMAKPQRLEENADGVVYVNDRCINCAACSNFAPDTFARSPRGEVHIVKEQPSSSGQIENARAALAACPVAAIRVETKAERRHRAAVLATTSKEVAVGAGDKAEEVAQVEDAWTPEDESLVQKMSIKPKKQGEKTSAATTEAPFPRKFLGDMTNVHHVGYHNERSFGATPYLVQTQHHGKNLWIMVDTPRFGSLAIKAVESLTGPNGPDYLFLTHVDDTADHGKWAEHYPSLRRILHAAELDHNWLGDKTLEDVEVLLSKDVASAESGMTVFALNGTVLMTNAHPDDATAFADEGMVILHTPGHSPGSVSLYKYPSKEDQQAVILFTGDTYAYTTRNGGFMTAFPRYGNDLARQSQTLKQLVQWPWNVIAPGHGHPRDYRAVPENEVEQIKLDELEPAQAELQGRRRW